MLQQSRERVLDCWTSAMLWWLRIAGSRMENGSQNRQTSTYGMTRTNAC